LFAIALILLDTTYETSKNMSSELDLNTGETTPGLSANTMGLDQASQRQVMRRRLFKFGAAFALLFAVAIGVVLYDKSLSTLTAKTLANGDYTYSLSFYRSAKEVRLESSNALKYGDTVIAQIRPTKDSYLSNCAEIGSAWRKVSTVNIGGRDRPICSANNQAYYTNFEKDGERHLIILTYLDEQVDGMETIESIVRSVRVAK
jgi:hypothetical protein